MPTCLCVKILKLQLDGQVLKGSCDLGQFVLMAHFDLKPQKRLGRALTHSRWLDEDTLRDSDEQNGVGVQFDGDWQQCKRPENELSLSWKLGGLD